jgi:hypothetical protein
MRRRARVRVARSPLVARTSMHDPSCPNPRCGGGTAVFVDSGAPLALRGGRARRPDGVHGRVRRAGRGLTLEMLELRLVD